MGFLDRLVSDLVSDATGLKSRQVRKIIRGVGMKNILMVGGAALAGGMAATQSGSSRSPAAPSPSSPRNPPPDLPPVPGASLGNPPPLPPLPSGKPDPDLPPLPSAQSEEPPESTISIEVEVKLARAMIAAALADGHLDEREREVLSDRIESSDLDPKSKRLLERDLVEPPTPDALARLASTDNERKLFVDLAETMISVDSEVTEIEASWLRRLREALGLLSTRP